MSWMAIAKARFSENRQNPTDETDETPLSSVSSVSSSPVSGKTQGVSSVSSVGVVGIFENCIPVEAVLEAAMRACDHHDDSEAARQEMRRQIAEVPAHLRAELLQHFDRAYPTQEDDP